MAGCRLHIKRKLCFILIAAVFLISIQNKILFRDWLPLPRPVYDQPEFLQIDQRLQLYVLLKEKHNLPVFIVDPILLLPLVPPSTREWISRDPAIEHLFLHWELLDHAEPPNTILTGIAANDTGKGRENLEELIHTIRTIGYGQGFQVKVTQGNAPTDIQITTSSGNAGKIPTHIFLSQSRYKLQIIVFHTVRNSSAFWTAARNKSLYDIAYQSSNPFEIPLGDKATLFDEFGLQEATLELSEKKIQLPVLVPRNVLHFIQQIPYSRFVQCNQTFAEEYRQKYSANYSVANQTIADTNSRFGLNTMKSLLRDAYIPFWACFGTLLGWWRQCGAIPYTTDLDFCTFSTFVKESEGMVEGMIEMAKATKKIGYMWSYGIPTDGLEMVFETIPNPITKQTMRSDLFFMYPASKEFKGNKALSGDGWLVYIHWYTTHQYQFYHLPRTTDFCSTLLWNLKVQVPCDPMPSIISDYGQNWKLPINEGFEYLGNVTDFIAWNTSVVPRIFGQYPIMEVPEPKPVTQTPTASWLWSLWSWPITTVNGST